ncbi:FG-GAP repeat domain-containing protein [Geothrix fuzhouensis]|uniref:FG-GAP repeat domain-containing protein n=1 Tax=Geothrix fuzhouensis TaxID=2966451 RepID=UPI00214779A6
MQWFAGRLGKGISFALGAAALLLGPACGGGGESGFVLPPFWVWGQVVVADLNGDGRLDVAVPATLIDGGTHRNSVQVFLRDAAGGFAAPSTYPLEFDPWNLCVGDVDGDGRPDLIVSIQASVPPQANVIGDSGGLLILRQDPVTPGHFLPATWVWTGGGAGPAAVVELTGDGRADVVVADGVFVHSRLLLLAQAPGLPGALLPPVPVPVGSGHGFRDLAVADVNGDGRPDLALAGYDCVAILYQQPGGGLAAPVFLSAGLKVDGVAAADLDGDGRVDLVAANAGNAPDGGKGGANVTVFLQNQPGSFGATAIPVVDGARQVVIGDLNGDGLPDLAVISLVYQSLSTPSKVTVLLQTAAHRGAFSVAAVLDGTMNANFIALGDLDGDGRTDLILNEGPSVMLQTAVPGTFGPPRSLR